MERTLEITSVATGRKYLFCEFTIFSTMVNSYSWCNNKWNKLTKRFNSLEEAEEWVKELDRSYEEAKNAPKDEYKMSASSYYSITGYYGD